MAVEELVEFGKREWDGEGLVNARAKCPGPTSMPITLEITH